jgi:CMP-N,N'-diacetyllegionaminic acid synthase
MRPAALASDTARQVDVALFVLDELAKTGRIYDLLVLLQPTSPFRQAADIDATIEALVREKSDCAFTVCQVEDSHHPAYHLQMTSERAHPLLEGLTGQRQVFPTVYRRNGAVYVVEPDMIRSKKSFHRQGAPVHVMPLEHSVNIDSPLDWAWAEFLLEKRMVST